MSLERRREMVERGHPSLPVVRQCALLSISRSGLYYRRKGALARIHRWTPIDGVRTAEGG